MYQLMDEEMKMLVGNMDVGCTITSCKCIHTLQNDSPYIMWKKDKSKNFTAWPLIAPTLLPRLGESMIALLILTLECFEDGLMMMCTVPFLRQMPNVLAAVNAWVQKTREQKNRSNISYCEKCNVSLCVLCFKPFHTISDVKKLKSQVRDNTEG